eukprot:TRINITY_DN22650_c0_g1_i2.p1 TRINITY_DN22650_c0_g1~~TRINITY_DN22650_c0_g1_i2.p1  ORF type:complete len:210 (+),score=27.31 TRINITY_DN22650_c0_g1_i2:229-858(+)
MRRCFLPAASLAVRFTGNLPASRFLSSAQPPKKLDPEALRKLGVATPAASAASRDKKKPSFDDLDDELPLPADEKPPALGVLGGFLAAGLGLLGWSLWRGYEAKNIWPKATGKVIKWRMSGSAVNPLATIQFGYTVDDKTWFFGEHEISAVHFDSQKVCSQFSIYDLHGDVDVHYDPNDPAVYAFEPGYFGDITPRPRAISREADANAE